MPTSRSRKMADPALILDRRTAMEASPGLHALLIGISDYLYLTDPDLEPPGEGFAALQKIDFTARSAFALKQKLVQLDAENRLFQPLKTIRLLISPSPAELAAEPALATAGGASPTREAIKTALWNWRSDVGKGRDEMSLFYFGGHGIRRLSKEAILLAGDFREPMNDDLARAFRLSEVIDGMAPGAPFPEIGRTQFYFIDACREKPEALDDLDDTATPKIWNYDLNGVDQRSQPVFHSTPSGGLAAGESGKLTYFMEALLWSLDHGAYRIETLPDRGAAWPIRSKSLQDGLITYNADFKDRFQLTGTINDAILSFAVDPPSLTVRIRIDPDTRRPAIGAALLKAPGRAAAIAIPDADTANICELKDVRAGLYQLKVAPKSQKPFRGAFKRYSSILEQVNVGLPIPWLHRIGP